MDLKEEGLIKGPLRNHWYYAAKLAALRSIISGVPGGTLLDVGSGSGFFAREMLSEGRMTSAICVDPGYPQDTFETVNGRPISFVQHVESTDAAVVLMMDVLEHVPHDTELVREYVEKVPSGSVFVVTVPAFSFLWSGHDVFLEHYRRYNLPQAESVLTSAGLVVEHGCYVYGTIFPAVASVRLARKLKGKADSPKSDMRELPSFVNTCLNAACKIDELIFKSNRLAGLSVMVRARKP